MAKKDENPCWGAGRLQQAGRAPPELEHGSGRWGAAGHRSLIRLTPWCLLPTAVPPWEESTEQEGTGLRHTSL